jgi:site-specific recombinase XerD
VNSKLLVNFITTRNGKKYANTYVNLREVSLSLFYAWAYQSKLCQNNPMLSLRIERLHTKPFPAKVVSKKFSTIDILKPDEQQKLLESMQQTVGDGFNLTRNIGIVKLMLDTAIYAAELIDLSLGDLDLANNLIIIRKGKARKIPINAEAKLACKEWLKVRAGHTKGKNIKPLFVTEKLNQLYKRGLYRIISKAIVEASLTKKHQGAEVLRQSAICNMLRKGMTIDAIQEITGINTLAYLKKYKDQVFK